MTNKNVNTESDVVERFLTNKVSDPCKMNNQNLEGQGVYATGEPHFLQTTPEHRQVKKSFQRKGPEFSRKN